MIRCQRTFDVTIKESKVAVILRGEIVKLLTPDEARRFGARIRNKADELEGKKRGQSN